jgi:hypothetical protein
LLYERDIVGSEQSPFDTHQIIVRDREPQQTRPAGVGCGCEGDEQSALHARDDSSGQPAPTTQVLQTQVGVCQSHNGGFQVDYR